MKIMIKNLKFILIFFLIIFSFLLNYYFGSIGILAIDSFAFFDTGYLILKGSHPFKDFWISTGPAVDYMQALFFWLFGVNWSSYLIHASSINVIICLSAFIFFLKNELNLFLSFLYAISVSILCYPVVGTPFAYHHAYVSSILTLFVFCIAVKEKNKIFWLLLPALMILSFLFMQTPSSYINIVIILFLPICFWLNLKKDIIYFFIAGLSSSLFLLVIYFISFEIPLMNFIEQYLLFPLSIGSNRIVGGDGSFVTLQSKFTLRGVIGHFKFIHLMLIIILTSIYLKSKNIKSRFLDEELIIFLAISLSSCLFIFNQLVTANQTYIFSLIPITACIAHLGTKKYLKDNQLINFFIITIVIFSTIKYFNVYVEKRKFIDLQNVNLNKAINATKIDKKFTNLKWISRYYPDQPTKEISVIQKALNTIKRDNRKKMIISDYQIFSVLLEENLNNPNRWYTNDGNSYPLKNHKFAGYYSNFLSAKIKNEVIEVIYIVDSNPMGEIKIDNFKIFLPEVCFESQDIIKDVFSMHKITKCKN